MHIAGSLAHHGCFLWVGAMRRLALKTRRRRSFATLQQYPGTELGIAWVYIQMGDRESALHWIAETEKAPIPWYPTLLGWVPGIELVADDPGIQERAAELGLADPRTIGCGT